MTYTVRAMTETDYPLLADFLYEAIFIPEGAVPPPKDIVNRPELQVYLTDFGGRAGDVGAVAEADGKVVGAAWARIMQDYGHIDDDTPSLAISLYKEYRGMGVGTALMKTVLELIRQDGYKQASLAVQKENYAVRLYNKVGFETVGENAEEYIMLCRFANV